MIVLGDTVNKSRSKIKPDFGVLFTCIGRRVSLLNSFRQTAADLGLNVAFYGTDTTPLSSALQLCDDGFLVKPTAHAEYIGELLSIVRRNNIKLIVPTVDLDLKDLASNKPRFEQLSCRVLVSDRSVVNICQDKRKTYRFLSKNGFGCPVTMSARSAVKNKKLTWPCFLKPWDGYAGRGNAIVKNRRELQFFASRIPNCIVQQFVAASEYTCDVYVDFNRRVRCVVPRRRIEIRAGEVSKSQIAKNPLLIDQTAQLVTKLGAGPGVITIQLFLTEDNQIKFVEINPRFGGGAPLSIKAGANFPKWILQELVGQKPKIVLDSFRDNLIMLRYDAEVWLLRYPGLGALK